ncbi:MAG: NADH:flavin oxidoreductase/NADH oxidase [Burkholderiaceae bacterium]
MAKLFEPLKLRELTVANRIVVSPMCQYSAVDGMVQPWHTAHLGQLAMSGAGMLVVEATAVEPEGRITPGCVGLYDDATEKALADLLTVLRSLNPSAPPAMTLQIGHAGRKASSFEPWKTGQQIPVADGGWLARAPSAIAHKEGEEPPHAMSETELDALCTRFVECARRADRAGFDALELHCAHGYLLHQFLSPVSNQRTDAFGGSLENRMRYPLQVLEAVRAVWPANKPLGVRISATDWDELSSWDLAESGRFSERCAALGADWIDVSSGGVSTRQKITLGPGYQVGFAAAVRERVDIPVMAVGLITEAAQAESIVADGQADMIALARAFLYDPRWVWHAAAELGAQVGAPAQYWRCLPAGVGRIFGDAQVGMR